MSCKVVKVSPDIAYWQCVISDERFETYGMVPTDYEVEKERIQHNREQDIRLESEMGREHVLFLEDEWPWYADRPYDVQDPEVFGP